MKYNFSDNYLKVDRLDKITISRESLEEIKQLEEDLIWFFEDIRNLVA